MVRWRLAVYQKTGHEEFLEDHPTTGIDAAFIRRAWSLPEDDPVIGLAYDITEDNVIAVQKHVEEKIDLERFQYSLYDTSSDQSAPRFDNCGIPR